MPQYPVYRGLFAPPGMRLGQGPGPTATPMPTAPARLVPLPPGFTASGGSVYGPGGLYVGPVNGVGPQWAWDYSRQYGTATATPMPTAMPTPLPLARAPRPPGDKGRRGERQWEQFPATATATPSVPATVAPLTAPAATTGMTDAQRKAAAQAAGEAAYRAARAAGKSVAEATAAGTKEYDAYLAAQPAGIPPSLWQAAALMGTPALNMAAAMQAAAKATTGGTTGGTARGAALPQYAPPTYQSWMGKYIPQQALGPWWQEFTQAHGGQTPVQYYGQAGQNELGGAGYSPEGTAGLGQALEDLQWSQQFAAAAGRPPNDREWRDHWYAIRGLNNPEGQEKKTTQRASKPPGGPPYGPWTP